MGVGTKAVATAAAAGGLLPIEDAEAGRVFSTGVDAARKFARRVIGDDKAPNILSDKKALDLHNKTEKQALRELEADLKRMQASMKRASPKDKEYIDVKMQERIASHVHTFTTYDDWSGAMREMEHGKRNGAGYLTGVDIMYEELRDRINPAHWDTLDKYADFRLGPKDKNGEIIHQGRRTSNSKDDYFGYKLKDEDYYRRLWGEESTFQHGATQEPKETAKQLMERTHREEAAKRAAAEEATRKQEIADEINAASETKGEPAKVATGKPEVDRSNLAKGLLGSTVGAGVVDPNDADSAVLPSDGIFGYPQQGSTVDAGFGPTAEEKLLMEYNDAHAGYRNQAEIMAPQSDTLQQITMGARGLERRLEGSPMSLLFPEGAINYLETVNRPNEDPNWVTRAFGLLDFMP